MNKQFTYNKDKYNKTWTITAVQNKLYIQSKDSIDGQPNVEEREFDNEAECLQEAEKQIEDKRKEGYKEVIFDELGKVVVIPTRSENDPIPEWKEWFAYTNSPLSVGKASFIRNVSFEEFNIAPNSTFSTTFPILCQLLKSAKTSLVCLTQENNESDYYLFEWATKSNEPLIWVSPVESEEVENEVPFHSEHELLLQHFKGIERMKFPDDGSHHVYRELEGLFLSGYCETGFEGWEDDCEGDLIYEDHIITGKSEADIITYHKDTGEIVAFCHDGEFAENTTMIEDGFFTINEAKTFKDFVEFIANESVKEIGLELK